MGAAAGQCRAALEPSCKEIKDAELPVPCDPCVAALQDDRVLVDPASYWSDAISAWDEADDQKKWPPRKPREVPSSSSDSRSMRNVRSSQVIRNRDERGQAMAPIAELVLPEKFGFAMNDQVTWIKSDEDVPRGAVGSVVGFIDDRVQVKFPKDTFHFKPCELTKEYSGKSAAALEANPDFAVNRYKTSGYLPAAKALERLPDPDDEEGCPPPPRSHAALELSRDAERQQHGGDAERQQQKADFEGIRMDSVPSDHLPVLSDHLRQQPPVAFSKGTTPEPAKEMAFPSFTTAQDAYAKASASLATNAPIRPNTPQSQVGLSPPRMPSTWVGESLNAVSPPRGALACYATAALAKQAAVRYSQYQAAAMEQQTMASIQAPSRQSSLSQLGGFAIRV